MLLLSSLMLISAQEYDTSLYIEGLESLIEEDKSSAEESFSQLLEQYPGSSYALSSRAYLDEIQSYVDNSGIVPFYLRNLATTTYTSFMLPLLLGIDEDTVTFGLAGLIGVGAGIGGSALMARDVEITSGLSWWMTTSQVVSFGNYLYLNGIFDLDDYFDYDTADDIFLSGQLLTLNGSLIASYAGFRNKDVSKGKGSFALQSYAWANAYYWMINGMLEFPDLQASSLVGMLVTDAAFAASLPAWDALRWTPMRSGLVSVGGLGGALVGFFSAMIIDNFAYLEAPAIFGMIMGSTLAGQAIAVRLTSSLEAEGPRRTADAQDIFLLPTYQPDRGAGFMISCML